MQFKEMFVGQRRSHIQLAGITKIHFRDSIDEKCNNISQS